MCTGDLEAKLKCMSALDLNDYLHDEVGIPGKYCDILEGMSFAEFEYVLT